MKKRGISQLIAAILLVVFIIGIAILIFSFMSKTTTLETTKTGDKAIAQEICRENVEIRINNVRESTIVKEGETRDILEINIENLKKQDITSFIVRTEKQGQVAIKKISQILDGYEVTTLKVDREFYPTVIKVIPQITLKKPDITSTPEGWWSCSDQIAVYNV